MTGILTLIGADVQLKRAASTNGGEWAGTCPWCGGRDRFRVWPKENRYWCRQCDQSGDAIQYIRERDNVGYKEACDRLNIQPKTSHDHMPVVSVEPLSAPCRQWQDRGWELVFDCQRRLMESDEGDRARAWLYGRGLTDETLWQYGLGYNPVDQHESRATWGMDEGKDIWLPRGITIPWVIDGELWRVNIRRPVGNPKYIGPAGFGNGLYGADGVRAGKPVILVEGEIDKLTIVQHAGDLVAAVATGSTSGARRTKWIARLALASVVLVAYDVDENGAGDAAARWWLDALPNAKRWRPLWLDVNKMAQDGADIRQWARAATEATLGEVEA